MAKMHTRLRGNETDGERYLYERFAATLPDYFHIWHNIIEPRNQKEIDMLVLHPKYGMWVIEVKDWLINQLRRIDAETCRLLMNGQEVEQRNPVRQARENHYPVRNLLAEETTLLHTQGRFEGNLLFPVHHVVVFSNISKAEMQSRDIYRLFPEHQLITADTIRDPTLDAVALENIFIEKRSPRFLNHHGLTKTQIAAINRLVNPSVELTDDDYGDEPDAPIHLPESTALLQKASPSEYEEMPAETQDIYPEPQDAAPDDLAGDLDEAELQMPAAWMKPPSTKEIAEPAEETPGLPDEPEPPAAFTDDHGAPADVEEYPSTAFEDDTPETTGHDADDDLSEDDDDELGGTAEVEQADLSHYEAELLLESRQEREIYPYREAEREEIAARTPATSPPENSVPPAYVAPPEPDTFDPAAWRQYAETPLQHALIDVLEINQQLLKRLWSKNQ